MGKRSRRAGRTGVDSGRRHLRAVRDDAPASPLDEIIDIAARDLLAAGQAIDAEQWASMFAATFEATVNDELPAGQPVPPLFGSLAERCLERGDKHALVVAAALGAVVPPPLDEEFDGVVGRLRRTVAVPSWVDAIGHAAPTQAWIVSDAYGDQDSLMIGFARPGMASEDAVVALVDHNLSGQAKDLFLTDDLEPVLAEWRSATNDEIHLRQLPVDDALARLRDALVKVAAWEGADHAWSDDVPMHSPLVWGRLHRAGFGPATAPPPEPDLPRAARDAVVADFLGSEAGQAAITDMPDADVEHLARRLVDLRCFFGHQPLRWSPLVVRLVLEDLAPISPLLDPDDAPALATVTRAFVRFAAERSGLAAHLLAATLAAVDDAAAVLSAADSPVARMPSSPQERMAAAPQEVVDAAAQAPAPAIFSTLADFFGDGRKLTQSGRPTLADARTLVELLGTDDVVDRTIGDRTFKMRSASDLPELSFLIRWAVSARVLRKAHGKLHATASWRKLERDPLRRWVQAVSELESLGPLAAYHADNPYRGREEVLDELLPDVLDTLADGPLAYDELLDVVCETADELFEWPSTMSDASFRRRLFGRDLDTVLRLLERAGIAERVDARVEPDDLLAEQTRLSGGTVRFTPVGAWWYVAE